MRKGSGIWTSLFHLFPVVYLFFTHGLFSLEAQDDEERLSRILTKAAAYCEKVKGLALFYVCVENTKDKVFFYRSSQAVKESPYGDV
jgi:hypothetical protein